MTITEFQNILITLIRNATYPTGNIFYITIEDKSKLRYFLESIEVGENEYQYIGNTIFIN